MQIIISNHIVQLLSGKTYICIDLNSRSRGSRRECVAREYFKTAFFHDKAHLFVGHTITPALTAAYCRTRSIWACLSGTALAFRRARVGKKSLRN